MDGRTARNWEDATEAARKVRTLLLPDLDVLDIHFECRKEHVLLPFLYSSVTPLLCRLP